MGVGLEGEIGVSRQGRIDADGLGICLAVDQAGETVHPVTANARAGMGGLAVLVLVEQHAQRQMGGVQAEPLEIVVEFLNARLVLDGRIGELAAARPVGGVFAGGAVHVIQAFGLGIVRLEVLVGQRPRRREPAVVLYHFEVLLAQTEQGGPVELGVAPYVVVLLGREFVSVFVDPLFGAVVLGSYEYRHRLPVVPLPGQVGPALEQQNTLSRRGQLPGQGATASPAADDHHVIMVEFWHVSSCDGRSGLSPA